VRCAWAGSDPLYQAYHDDEWGVPVADDTRLFEKICLEGFQAGLSWITILRKREAFRRAFAGFDPARLARFRAAQIERLLLDPGIVRHRGKIESAVRNAGRALEMQRETGSLAGYLWSFAPASGGSPRAVTTCAEAVALSRDLKRRGWTFVGPTTLYAFMQAVGFVNDHLEGCARRAAVAAARRRFVVPPAAARPTAKR